MNIHDALRRVGLRAVPAPPLNHPVCHGCALVPTRECEGHSGTYATVRKLVGQDNWCGDLVNARWGQFILVSESGLTLPEET